MSTKRIILHGHSPFDANEAIEPLAHTSRQRVFLISPANTGGTRAQRLLGGKWKSDLAKRLNESGVPLDEIFIAMSTLYFRGKLSYAQKFSNPPAGLPAILIITPSRGLLLPRTPITLSEMVQISSVRALHTNPSFRDPLERDARILSEQLGAGVEVILLGSIATLKYIEPLVAVFGPRLTFPGDFLGLGNMRRGGLLLRCCRENRELRYIPVADVMHRVVKPGKKKKSTK
jgi:hypothetical protein